MTLDIFKLSFTSPLHLSKGKLETYESSEDVLHSDTLKSALFVTALQLYGDSVLEEDFFGQFQVSSAFPYADDAFYFPKPYSFNPSNKPEIRKDLKKIRYVRRDYFERILAGEKKLPETELIDTSDPDIWKSDNTQRVVIDRVNSQGVPFYLEKLYPVQSENRGLYFIVRAKDAALLDRLEWVARLLGENGIGLQRGLGNGCFEVKRGRLELNLPDNANASVSLSLYRPIEGEINTPMLESGFYDFMQRGGWIASPEQDEHRSIRKKSVYMFKEGSVFGFQENPAALTLRGEKVDITPDNKKLPFPLKHEIWRDGSGLFLPIRM